MVMGRKRIKMSRRKFLKIAGLTTGSVFVGGTPFNPGRAPGAGVKTTIHALQPSNTIPAMDEELKKISKQYEKQTGVRIRNEFINQNDVIPKLSASVEAGAGPDVFQVYQNQPHLYAKSLAEVSDVVEDITKKIGQVYPMLEEYCKVKGAWLGVPWAFMPHAWTYRTDYFQKVGATKPFDTWDEARAVGKKLKGELKKPLGVCFGHTWGDAPAICYPMFWAFGGKVTSEDGKTITINSKETEMVIEWVVGFFHDALDETGLGWDDGGNNRAYLAQTISATENAPSIYLAAKNKFPNLLKVSDNFPNPKGPAGRFTVNQAMLNMVPTYTKKVKAVKEYLAYLMEPENYLRWLTTGEGFHTPPAKGLEKDRFWLKDPKMLAFAESAKYSVGLGWPGPSDRHATEVFNKYIIVDLFAKAIGGMKPKDVIAWAEQELRIIYRG
jgi:multiple sugar transport system substrate-binding protein